MRRLMSTVGAVATALAVGAAPAGALSPVRPTPPPPGPLSAFDSCEQLVAEGQRRTARPTPYPEAPEVVPDPGPTLQASPAPAASPSSPLRDSSGTNVQEAWVDEPDVVETNGRHIFAVDGRALHVVDARAKKPRKVAGLPLSEGYGHQLMLLGDRLIVIASTDVAAHASPRTVIFSNRTTWRPAVTLLEIDVSNPAAPTVVRKARLDGSLVGARRHGRAVRVVTSTTPDALTRPLAGERDRWDDDRAWRPSSRFEDLRTGHTAEGPAVRCDAVRRGPHRPGNPVTLHTIHTVDLARGLPAVATQAVLDSAEHGQTRIYASRTSLYLVRSSLSDKRTTLHRFDASRSPTTTYTASGEVPGQVLSAFSLSEHEGSLRIATTSETPAAGRAETSVTVLRRRGAALERVGRVGGLGKGEQVHAVRFLGDVGYVVTFRRVDPFYTLDLSRASAPRVVGELKIPGFSSYLHPIAGDLVLGVGQHAGADGVARGAQVSLFDVRDPARPKRLDRRSLGASAFSPAEGDHHAFLFWPRERLAVVPVRVRGGAPWSVGYRVSRGRELRKVGSIVQGGGRYAGGARRSLVVGRRLFTYSPGGLMATALRRRFGAGAWVPLAPAHPTFVTPG
jgi:Beta propeller domain